MKISVMKNLLLIVFLFSMFSTKLCGQFFENPTIDSKNSENVGIMSVELTSTETIIHFLYQSSELYVNGGWFNINRNIKLRERGGYRTFKLQKALGVKLSPEKTYSDFKGQLFSFQLKFERLSSNISEFDIIECDTENCFNFYGVKININASPSNSELSSRFRRDYSHVCFWEPKTETWSEWNEGDNTFVINHNDNGDIAHYKANGEVALYKKISGVEEGYAGDDNEHYQIITALDEDGLRFRFQFFDNPQIGLKLIYGDIIVQFAKL